MLNVSIPNCSQLIHATSQSTILDSSQLLHATNHSVIQAGTHLMLVESGCSSDGSVCDSDVQPVVCIFNHSQTPSTV
jgi:hypothetical protein